MLPYRLTTFYLGKVQCFNRHCTLCFIEIMVFILNCSNCENFCLSFSLFHVFQYYDIILIIEPCRKCFQIWNNLPLKVLVGDCYWRLLQTECFWHLTDYFLAFCCLFCFCVIVEILISSHKLWLCIGVFIWIKYIFCKVGFLWLSCCIAFAALWVLILNGLPLHVNVQWHHHKDSMRPCNATTLIPMRASPVVNHQTK